MANTDSSLAKMECGDFDSTLDEKHTRAFSKQQASSARINPRIISDATIGLSDGLTVPFALTAGLSALGDTRLVIYGGIAELIAGGISMGLGGYLGAKSEAEAYESTLAETESMVELDRDRAATLARSTFQDQLLSRQTLDRLVEELQADAPSLADFLMRYHHQLAETDFTSSRAYVAGLTIAMGYFFGGLVPLLPYTLCQSMDKAFQGSVVVMVIALFAFGWLKTALLGNAGRIASIKSGLQMVMLGGTAAGAAMACVKAVGESGP